jgi:hypothetical protein
LFSISGVCLAFQSETTFKFEKAKLHVFASQFEPRNHNIKKCEILNWTGVCLIDGKPAMGTDWEHPKTKFDKAVFEINGKQAALDVSYMYNPWFSKPKKEQFTVKKSEGGWTIQGFFSDGAGSYVAEWVIVSGVSIRTILSNNELIYTALVK